MMKLKRFFILVPQIFWFAIISGSDERSVVPYAINAIIDEHFATTSATRQGLINIVWIGEKTEEFSKLVGTLLRMKSPTATLQVFVLEEITEEGGIYDNAIVFFDSVEIFQANFPKIWWVDLKQRNHYLVYVPGLTVWDIHAILLNGFNIDNVNFLMHETDNSIELVTSFMITPTACRKLQLKTINRFDLETTNWENSIFYPKKYNNFYNCELVVAMDPNNYGRTYNLLQLIFGRTLKAKLVQKMDANLFFCPECDLMMLEFGIFVLYDDFIFADPHRFELYTFAVSTGEPYTEVERMFMMFSLELWIAIAITLSIAIFATIMLKFVSKKIRDFIVGRYVNNPTMNIISIFLTGSQFKTPGRNFARFLLILFIIWSLIIRNCHQSMLFQLLQADLRRPAMQTLDAIFESNLTVYLQDRSYLLDDYFKERMKMPSTK